MFEYDLIGNPTTYRGKTATWAYGRRLTYFDGATFTYDARGRRTSKNNITFTYDSNGNLLSQSNGLEFIYDHTGIVAVIHNGATYFYRKNAQNDIIALLDATGNVVAKYAYDVWGNHKVIDASGVEITDSNNIANLNPFRYRSYYFDVETDLYFLKTRYYDPEIGRFITIDDITYLLPDTINGLNLYAYCGNNPVMRRDTNGTSFKSFFEGLINGFNRFRNWMNENALNDDGTYSLYDNDRFHDDNAWHEQILAASVSSAEDNITLGSLALDLYTGGWEGEYVNFSLFDFGHAEAGAEIKNGDIKFGALASIWSPSFSFSIGKLSVDIGAEVGAVGAGFKKVNNGFSVFGAYGFGGSLTFSLND